MDGDVLFIHVVNGIGSAPVAVTGLTHATDVDEVLYSLGEGCVQAAGTTDGIVLLKNAGRVGMAVEAQLGELVAEAGHRIEAVGHVSPGSGGVERGMNNGEITYLTDQLEVR